VKIRPIRWYYSDQLFARAARFRARRDRLRGAWFRIFGMRAAFKKWSQVQPCAHCHAPDSRAPDHQRGCPKLPPVSPERLAAIAAACERGWREKTASEREGKAERTQRAERNALANAAHGRRVNRPAASAREAFL
jgi:hypothetical protein